MFRHSDPQPAEIALFIDAGENSPYAISAVPDELSLPKIHNHSVIAFGHLPEESRSRRNANRWAVAYQFYG